MPIAVTSSAFHDGELIPKRYTCDGESISPPLAWSGVPKEAVSLVVICIDPDAPRGTFTHWVLYNLPATANGLPAGVQKTATLPNGAVQGMNNAREVGYTGPCPPPGPAHRYQFHVYALDIRLDVQGEVTRERLLAAMNNHVLAAGEITGKYGR